MFSQKYLELIIPKGLFKTLGALASLLYMSLTHILSHILPEAKATEKVFALLQIDRYC